jgi:hypothetical protein
MCKQGGQCRQHKPKLFRYKSIGQNTGERGLKAKQRSDTNNTYQTIGLLARFYMMTYINSSIFFSNSSEKVLLTNVYVCGFVIYVQPRVMYVRCECATQSIYYDQLTSQHMVVTVPAFSKITLLHYGCEYPSTTDVTQPLSQTYMMQSKEH